MAGARVVPIRYNADEAEVKRLASKVNAVLFTGGPSKPTEAPAPYFQTATLLYQLATSSSIPLWGTCLGLQTISCIANGGVNVLGDFPLENFAYPLSLTAAASSSKMFGGLSASGLADFAENVTTNWHHYGVAPSALTSTRLVPLATNVALNGKTFVSALEGEGGLQVFAVQVSRQRSKHPICPPALVASELTHSTRDWLGAVSSRERSVGGVVGWCACEECRSDSHRRASRERSRRASAHQQPHVRFRSGARRRSHRASGPFHAIRRKVALSE